MNNFYVDKIKKIQTSLLTSQQDPLQKLRKIMENNQVTFSVLPVHPDLIDEIMSNSRN